MGLFSPPSNASWVEILPDGHQGTLRTLDAMRYLVRKDCNSYFVRFTVSNLIKALGALTPIESLFFFSRDQIRYREDPPTAERVADFQRTFEARYGDCDDKVVWLATALCSIGVSTRFVVQSYGEDWNHVYLEFYDWPSWDWVALDPTADGHDNTIVAPVGWRQLLPSGGYEMRFSV